MVKIRFIKIILKEQMISYFIKLIYYYLELSIFILLVKKIFKLIPL